MHRNLLTLLICLLGTVVWGQLTNNGATIVIESGATLYVEGNVQNLNSGTIDNSGVLQIKGNLDNQATINSLTGDIEFQGGVDNLLTSTSPFSVKNFIINKTGGKVNITSLVTNDITIDAQLNFMADGYVDINAVNLILGSTATIPTSSSTKFVITDGAGELRKTSQSGSFTFPIGYGGAGNAEYNPITINNTGAASTMGVKSLQDAYADGPTGAILDDVITASWQVSGGDPAALNVTLNWDGGDEGAFYNPLISGVARWTGTYWDHSLDDPAVVGSSVSRDGLSAGTLAVGGESVMDEVLLTPQVVFTGPYNGTTSGTLMNTNLTALLPVGEPYSAMPAFTHKALGGGETATAGFGNVVDWVFLEVRSAGDNTNILGSYSALLMDDGNIVGTDKLQLKLKGLKSGATSPGYYIAVRHRNHLGVMTNGIVGAGSLSRSSNTNADIKSIGTAFGTNPFKNNTNGIYSLWPGDAHSDGTVKYQGANNDDIDIRNGILGHPGNIFNFLSYSFSEYSTLDVNLDGTVKYQGANNDDIEVRNVILGHPGNIFNFLSYSFSSQIPN